MSYTLLSDLPGYTKGIMPKPQNNDNNNNGDDSESSGEQAYQNIMDSFEAQLAEIDQMSDDNKNASAYHSLSMCTSSYDSEDEGRDDSGDDTESDDDSVESQHVSEAIRSLMSAYHTPLSKK